MCIKTLTDQFHVFVRGNFTKVSVWNYMNNYQVFGKLMN
jgi:hypothetical protein